MSLWDFFPLHPIWGVESNPFSSSKLWLRGAQLCCVPVPGVIPKALGKQELLCYLVFYCFFIKKLQPQTGHSVRCLPGASAHPWDKQPSLSIAPVYFQAIPPGSAPRLLQVSHILLLLLLLQSPGSSTALISHLPGSQVGALPPLLPRASSPSKESKLQLPGTTCPRECWILGKPPPLSLLLQVLPKSLPAAWSVAYLGERLFPRA